MAPTEYEVFELDGVEVKLSSPDKVYFPQCGVTKGQLAHFYVDCADAVLNHLRERPTVLKRYAGGIEAKPFYQKRVPAKRPEWLQTTVLTFPSGNTAEEFVPVDAAHLVWAVSLGNVDFNPHPVRRADLDHPDELRVDIDPMPGATWDTVRRVVADRARRAVGERPARLPGHVGSRGMHIPVRIHPEWDFVDGPPRGACAGARGRAPRRGPRHREVVEGGAPARLGASSTTTRTPRTTRSRACTPCARSPTRASAARSSGTRCPTASPGDFRVDTVPGAARVEGRSVVGHRRPPRLARRPARAGRRRRARPRAPGRALADPLRQAARRGQARAAQPRAQGRRLTHPRPTGHIRAWREEIAGVQAAVGVLSSKWSVAILAELADGTHRFNELLRHDRRHLAPDARRHPAPPRARRA